MTTVWDFWIIESYTFICSRSGESAAVWSRNATKCTAGLSTAATTTESAVAVATTAADSATDTATTTTTNAAVAATAATCEFLNLYNLF